MKKNWIQKLILSLLISIYALPSIAASEWELDDPTPPDDPTAPTINPLDPMPDPTAEDTPDIIVPDPDDEIPLGWDDTEPDVSTEPEPAPVAPSASTEIKRIYTIKEATEALGKTNRNTFSIRYR